MPHVALRELVGGAIAVVLFAGGCDSPHRLTDDVARTTRQKKPATSGKTRPTVARPTAEVAPSDAATMSIDDGSLATAENVSLRALPAVDDARIAAQGIRKVASERLTLYTDLPADAAVDELPRLFALAVPEWCDYLQIDAADLADWRLRGCLMKDRARFIAAGLLPAELDFENAITRDNEIWWNDQPSDYYRRHLMLHEGTHALMFSMFGSCGPAWYMEGLAELLGAHRLADGKLMLGIFPDDPAKVPYWGRIRLVNEAVRAGHALSLDEVLAFSAAAHSENEAYGWSWAIAAFLDGHPRYRERFRQLPRLTARNDFNDQFRRLFADDWAELVQEWQAFIHDLDFGYDLVRNAIDFIPAEPLGDSQTTLTVAADRGWQSSGLQLEPGMIYELTAKGRYKIAAEPKIWWCEPDGVTIRYFHGKPLGMLLAIVLPDADVAGEAAWPSTHAIGKRGELAAAMPGTLYLRINDAPGELSDNAGSLKVTIRSSPKRDSR